MNKLMVTASLLAFTAFAAEAQADPAGQRWPNWYLGLSGGPSFLGDSDIKITGIGNTKMTFNNGSAEEVALGYLPPDLDGFRFELEGGYHYNTIDRVAGVGAPGSVRVWSYMANAFYDLRNNTQFTPYLGVGAGDANVHVSKTLLVNSGSDSVFAYQLMAGVSYAPTTIPNTEWTLGYRYFSALNPSFSGPIGDVKLNDVTYSQAELGARFKF